MSARLRAAFCASSAATACAFFSAFLVVDRLLRQLRRAGVTFCKQSLLAHRFEMITGYVGLACLDVGLGLRDHCLLQALLLLDVVNRRSGGVDIGLRLTELGAVVVVNDIDDGIARVNPLKVLNVDGSDVSGNLGGHRRRIGLQIRVVGGLQRGRAYPKVPFVGDNEDQTSDKKEDEQPDDKTQPKSGGQSLWAWLFMPLRRYSILI